ncbi:hypothetical protein DB41_JT00010 [Neochlamydia sp. TUME1]|uniref:hypothetical protein n=1 Tax=Neochlamydia sp. TUME1 TaxID=1478174 RepID=UPI000580436F|nr:hypothetical protein [Neochlamydia sp. TUME1]KIC73065.1 hypothetical protein DB41_JT00010 [Neochlamydia sp. TUME1]
MNCFPLNPFNGSKFDKILPSSTEWQPSYPENQTILPANDTDLLAKKARIHRGKSTLQETTSVYFDYLGCLQLGDEEFIKAVNKVNLLAKVVCKSADSLTDKSLLKLQQHAKVLRKLQLSSAKQMTEEGISLLVEQCHSLKMLALNAGPTLEIRFAQALSSCAQLKKLDLSFIPSITDKAIQIIAQGCRGLEKLKLRDCKKISDSSLVSISQNTRQLVKLNLSGCSHITGEELGSSDHCFFPYLAKIDLSYCSSLTNLGFQAIMGQTPQLRSLKLNFCQQLAPAVLAQEIGKLSLEKLNLTACHIEDSFFKHSFFSLLSLNITSCQGFTNEAFQKLAQTAPVLEKLNVGFCTQLKGKSVKALASKLARLKHLNLSFTKINSSCFSHLAALLELESLNIRYMKENFYLYDLALLLNTSSSLKHLVIDPSLKERIKKHLKYFHLLY